MQFDVVIVGGGPGGAIAAKTLEGSGLKTCIIDRKPRKLIGRKVCGDAIGNHHFDFLNRELGLPYPDEEVKCRIKGVKIFSPNMNVCFNTETPGGGYMMDRLIMGQKFLDSLKETEIYDSTEAIGVLDNGLMTNNGKIEAKTVIDASGTVGIIRRNLASGLIENNVDKADYAICHREIRQFEMEDKDYCRIVLNQDMSPGGYIWEFPKGDRINVGMGVQYPVNPVEKFNNYIRGKPYENCEIINAGGGAVPVRRPINSLVDVIGNTGFLIVGDSACQVNPIHGGGIGQAMIGGFTAAKTLISCEGDYSLKNIWEYNRSYMKNFGYRNAGLDVFRLLLQALSNAEINYGMEKGLIKEEDLLRTSEGEDLKLSMTEKISRAVRGIGNLDVLGKLSLASNRMKEVKTLYRNYPDIEGFPAWRQNIERFFADVKMNLNA